MIHEALANLEDAIFPLAMGYEGGTKSDLL